MLGLSRRKKLNTLFGVDVPAELLRNSEAFSRLRSLEPRTAHLLLVAVDGGTEAEMNANLGTAIDLASEHRWMICTISSNFAVLVESGVLNQRAVETSAAVLAQKLDDRLKSRVKSIGGVRVVAWGECGSDTRRALGPFFPDFLQLVSRLEQQPFGTHVEFDAR